MCKQETNRGLCSNKEVRDGYCTFHYNRLKGSDLELELPECKQMLSRENAKGDKKCTKVATTDGYCTFHYNRLNKKDKTVLLCTGVARACTCPAHSVYSNYPQSSVPIEKFYKPNKPHTDLYKRCEDCRLALREQKNRTINKYSNISSGDDNLSVCTSIIHNNNGVSSYPRDQVPKHLFLGNPEDPKSIRKYCLDCRNRSNSIMDKSLATRKEAVKDDPNNFFCSQCRQLKPNEEKSLKLNGNISKVTCISCKEKSRERKKNSYAHCKSIYREVQYEIMLKCQASCEECKSIFLQPKKDEKHVTELKPQNNNGYSVVEYEGVIYSTIEFIEKFRHLLEFRILDFDHLPEDELRKRSILKPDEEYAGKQGHVTHLHNEFEIRKEAKVCQLICCRCHTRLTYERSGKTKVYGKRKEKRKYINSLREVGCSECKFYDETLPYFLEFDHLNPSDKIANISHMATSEDFSIEHLKEECLKTRILCRFCHRIHTAEQYRNNII